jgi:hypothetical protein
MQVAAGLGNGEGTPQWTNRANRIPDPSLDAAAFAADINAAHRPMRVPCSHHACHALPFLPPTVNFFPHQTESFRNFSRKKLYVVSGNSTVTVIFFR